MSPVGRCAFIVLINAREGWIRTPFSKFAEHCLYAGSSVMCWEFRINSIVLVLRDPRAVGESGKPASNGSGGMTQLCARGLGRQEAGPSQGGDIDSEP